MYRLIGNLYEEQERYLDPDPIASDREFEKAIKYLIDESELIEKTKGKRPFPSEHSLLFVAK